MGFDNQLGAVERTLQAKIKDYEELLLLSGDANHAREVYPCHLRYLLDSTDPYVRFQLRRDAFSNKCHVYANGARVTPFVTAFSTGMSCEWCHKVAQSELDRLRVGYEEERRRRESELRERHQVVQLRKQIKVQADR